MVNRQSANTSTPAELGFSMPAEWEPHKATWLGWPHNASDWPGKFAAIPWVYGEMVRNISASEIVRLLVRHPAEEKLARRVLQRTGCNLKKIRFVVHPTNRGWTRDSGPIFLKRPSPRSLSHRMGEGGRRPGEGAFREREQLLEAVCVLRFIPDQILRDARLHERDAQG